MTETGRTDEEVRSIERAFYRIDDGETNFPTCSVAIEISGIGSWIVKFSINGIVVNNCDIIFAIEPNDCSARIQFKSQRLDMASMSFDPPITFRLPKSSHCIHSSFHPFTSFD